MFESKGLPKTKQTPIIYLSGYAGGLQTEKKQLEWLRRTGCKSRCHSFAYCCPGAFYYSKPDELLYKTSLANGVRIMMDSGAFSFHGFLKNMTGKVSKKKKRQWNPEDIVKLREETIEKYVQYCRVNSRDWDFYCNFDYRPHAPLVLKMQHRLEKLGMRPAPVFHGDMGLDYLENYCKDGHKLICVGTTAMQGRSTWKKKKYFYDRVFNMTEKHGVKVHGLAVTALSLMFQYPWASVDSATWIRVAAVGCVMYMNPERGVLGHMHISETPSNHDPSYNRMTKPAQKAFRNQVAEMGFEFEKLRDLQVERGMYNAYLFMNRVHQAKEIIERNSARWETLI